MMNNLHVNSIRQSTDDFNRNELSSLTFNHTSTSPPMGVCAHPTNSRQPIRLVAGLIIEGGKLADRTDLFLIGNHRRAQRLWRIKFRLRRAGLPRYRIEKIIEAKRHEI